MFGLGKKKGEHQYPPAELEDIEAVWNWCDNLVVEAKDMRRDVEEFRDAVGNGKGGTTRVGTTELDFQSMIEANLTYVYRAIRELRKECGLPPDD